MMIRGWIWRTLCLQVVQSQSRWKILTTMLGRGSDSDSDGDPFEGRPDEIFREESDEEEDCAFGDNFQAAPWLQGLSAQERLEEVFNVDAATRGHCRKKAFLADKSV
ncbi:hypothetical protein MVEN_00026300 [Mycena venus]|uniref:Uncharacterized protein n=1 Tax=Mycena venus TaxID=2733690 RepID=A0A8H6Z669_9AGAR|nr:hypothetical protein MVEN_00026300 [Mycena venus]